MEKVLAIALVFVPLLIAVLFARRYNIFIGLFTFFFAAFIMYFVEIKVSGFANLCGYSSALNFDTFIQPIIALIHKYTFAKLGNSVAVFNNEWLQLAVWTLLFVIFFAISAAVRRSSKRRKIRKYSNLRVVAPRY